MADGGRKTKEAEAARPLPKQSSASGPTRDANPPWGASLLPGVQPADQLCAVGDSPSANSVAALLWFSQRSGNRSINQSLATPQESTGQQLIKAATADPQTHKQLLDRAYSKQDVSGSILEKIIDQAMSKKGGASSTLLPTGVNPANTEYLKGDLIRDARGKLAADGLILGPADEADVRPVLTHAEAKAGKASASGLHIGKGESDPDVAKANRSERILDLYSNFRDARAGEEREYGSWSPTLTKRVKGKNDKQLMSMARRVVDDRSALAKLGFKYTEAESGGQFFSANERMREIDSIRVYKTPPRTEAEVNDPSKYRVVKIRYSNATVLVAFTPSDVSPSATLSYLQSRGRTAKALQPKVTSEELKIEQAKLYRETGKAPPGQAAQSKPAPANLAAKPPPLRMNLIEQAGRVPPGPNPAGEQEAAAKPREPLKAYTGVAENHPFESHGQSLGAARWEAGANAATVGLELANWGINKLAAAKREEIVNAELAKLEPALAARLAAEPQLGARVVIVYDQFEGNPESPLQPPATFARLEWSVGRNEREALQRWQDQPALRRGLVRGEHESIDVRWYTPAQPTPDVPLPKMPFPAAGLATFAPGKAQLLQVGIWALSGFDDEQDFDVKVPKGMTPRFHILQLPKRFAIMVQRGDAIDSEEIRTHLVDRTSASKASVPAVDLDPFMPFANASAVCVFPADEATLQLFQTEGPRTLGNQPLYDGFEYVYWVRPENLAPLP